MEMGPSVQMATAHTLVPEALVGMVSRRTRIEDATAALVMLTKVALDGVSGMMIFKELPMGRRDRQSGSLSLRHHRRSFVLTSLSVQGISSA